MYQAGELEKRGGGRGGLSGTAGEGQNGKEVQGRAPLPRPEAWVSWRGVCWCGSPRAVAAGCPLVLFSSTQVEKGLQRCGLAPPFLSSVSPSALLLLVLLHGRGQGSSPLSPGAVGDRGAKAAGGGGQYQSPRMGPCCHLWSLPGRLSRCNRALFHLA